MRFFSMRQAPLTHPPTDYGSLHSAEHTRSDFLLHTGPNIVVSTVPKLVYREIPTLSPYISVRKFGGCGYDDEGQENIAVNILGDTPCMYLFLLFKEKFIYIFIYLYINLYNVSQRHDIFTPL